MNSSEIILGSFEMVSFPALHINNVWAKIDTGAYSGAIHCSKITEKTLKIDGVKKKVLRVIFLDNRHKEFDVEKYIKTVVRSSTGHIAKRYLVDTTIMINGKAYSTRIGLSDRSDMSYGILIGRRFLRENGMIVDVRINQEHDIDRNKKL